MRKIAFAAGLVSLMCVSLLIGVLAFQASKPETTTLKDMACADLIVYGVRGTSPTPGPGAPAEAFAEDLRSKLGEDKVELVPAVYPGEQDSLEEYRWSVDTGRVNGLDFLTEASSKCPDSRFLVVGFSQGGQVAHLMMKDLEEARYSSLRARTWAILVSDPLRSPTDPIIEDAVVGGASMGPGDYIFQGDGEPVLLTDKSSGRVLSLCHAEDGVCNAPGQTSGKLDNPHFEGWSTDEAKQVSEAWLSRLL